MRNLKKRKKKKMNQKKTTKNVNQKKKRNQKNKDRPAEGRSALSEGSRTTTGSLFPNKGGSGDKGSPAVTRSAN